jgi:hypothetical protein
MTLMGGVAMHLTCSICNEQRVKESIDVRFPGDLYIKGIGEWAAHRDKVRGHACILMD